NCILKPIPFFGWLAGFFIFLFVCLFVFRDRVSLCYIHYCPGTHSVDQLLASASQVLGLKAYATTPGENPLLKTV
ncbi:hypothetical protein, partial [Clostridium perfringens]